MLFNLIVLDACFLIQAEGLLETVFLPPRGNGNISVHPTPPQSPLNEISLDMLLLYLMHDYFLRINV